MIPYANLSFFMIIGILLIPVIIAGYHQKRLVLYNSMITIVVLLMAFASDIHQVGSILAYVIWEIILVSGYIAYRHKKNSTFIFYLVIFLSHHAFISNKNLAFF